MKLGNAAFELADLRAEQEREAGIARARTALKGEGRLVCDCGEIIPDARRKALPNAKDCFDCAALAERQTRRRA